MLKKLYLIITIQIFSLVNLTGAAKITKPEVTCQLREAVINQDHDEIDDYLMSNTFYINKIYPDGKNILHEAVKNKNTAILKKILLFEFQSNPLSTNKILKITDSLERAFQTKFNGLTPLDLAIFYSVHDGKTDRVKLLLNAGASASGYEGCELTPLHNAILAMEVAGDRNFLAHIEIINLLVKYGAKVDALDVNKFCALELALKIGKNPSEGNRPYNQKNKEAITQLLFNLEPNIAHRLYITNKLKRKSKIATLKSGVLDLTSKNQMPQSIGNSASSSSSSSSNGLQRAPVAKRGSTLKIEPSVRNLHSNTLIAGDLPDIDDNSDSDVDEDLPTSKTEVVSHTMNPEPIQPISNGQERNIHGNLISSVYQTKEPKPLPNPDKQGQALTNHPSLNKNNTKSNFGGYLFTVFATALTGALIYKLNNYIIDYIKNNKDKDKDSDKEKILTSNN